MDFSTRKGMIDFLRAARFSYVLRTVAEMEIAVHVGDGCTFAELTSRLKAHESALRRIIQLCSTMGIFEVSGDRVLPTAGSSLLRSDVADSLVPVVRFTTDPDIREAYGMLDHSVQTGESSFTRRHGKDSFAYFAENPLGKVFSEAMESVSYIQDQQCAEIIAKRVGKTVMDVGGGKGGLLEQIASRSSAQAILFDLPSVIDQIDQTADGLQLEKGDFFQDQLPNADTIVLRKILHDWGDEENVKILMACRQALQPGGKIAVVEVIKNLGEAEEEFAKSLMDIEMLVMTGKGGERSKDDFDRLFQQAGLQIDSVESVDALYSVVWVTL